MRRVFPLIAGFSLLMMLNSCFILGQLIYEEDDCRLYYIYSLDPYSGRKTLEWESSICGAGGGFTRWQWNAKYEKLKEQNPETYYSQEVLEYKNGDSYTFDSNSGYVVDSNPYNW